MLFNTQLCKRSEADGGLSVEIPNETNMRDIRKETKINLLNIFVQALELTAVDLGWPENLKESNCSIAVQSNLANISEQAYKIISNICNILL